jgi:hypothetical protein
MADERERTLDMVQRRANYVPEELRPQGFGEKMGWYNAVFPWMVAERQYDTKPFGADIGVDKRMEYILRALLMGDNYKKPEQPPAQQSVPAPTTTPQLLVGEPNVQSNRFGAQSDFNR